MNIFESLNVNKKTESETGLPANVTEQSNNGQAPLPVLEENSIVTEPVSVGASVEEAKELLTLASNTLAPPAQEPVDAQELPNAFEVGVGKLKTTTHNGIFPEAPPIGASPEVVTRYCLDKCIIALDHLQYGKEVLAETWQHIANHPDHKDLLLPADMNAITALLVNVQGAKYKQVTEKAATRTKKAEEKDAKVAEFDDAFAGLKALGS